MYYLKCTECGEFNEITHDSQNYCYVCTARLENTFDIWKKKNPTKSFEDYLAKECVPEKLVMDQNAKRRRMIEKRENSKLPEIIKILVLLVVAIVLIGMGYYFMKPFMNDILKLIK